MTNERDMIGFVNLSNILGVELIGSYSHPAKFEEYCKELLNSYHVILGTARCLRQPINYTIDSQSESRTFPTNKDLRSSSLAGQSINSSLKI